MSELDDLLSLEALNKLSGYEIVEFDKGDLRAVKLGPSYWRKPEPSQVPSNRIPRERWDAVPKPGVNTVETVGYKYPFWDSVKSEMILFICTSDKKYADVKKKLKSAGKHSEIALVSMIAAAVAASVGVAVATLVPVCALILSAAVRVGTGAFCMNKDFRVKVQPIAQEKKRPSKAKAKPKK